jgi:hypothetical protein
MPCLQHSAVKNRRSYLPDTSYSRNVDWSKNPVEQSRQESAPSRYSHQIKGYQLTRREKTNWSIFFISPNAQGLTEAEAKFRYYASKWKEEIGGESSLTNITNNMNYLRIIRIGAEAIPLILQELQQHPAPWFVALRAITEDDSVGRNSPGNFRAMAAAWIQWGKDHGHI